MDRPSESAGSASSTCDCIVCNLKTKPFSERPFIEKYAIVNRGRATPKLSLTKEMKTFKRHFSESVYETYRWLTGCAKICKLFCWPCLLFSSEEKTPWNSLGFSDLNNLHKMVKSHSNRKCHLESCFNEKRFRSLRIIEHALDNQLKDDTLEDLRRHNEVVRRNREIMKRLIDVTCFLAEHELSFRGHNETETSANQGNYVDLLNLLARYDPILSNHFEQSTIFRGNQIQNDIINSIADVVLIKIQNEIEHAKFIAIIIDETTDISSKSQLSTVLRYVTKEGCVKERFIGFTCVTSDRSADVLYKIVCDILKTYECDEKLIAQSYDGATVMSGHLGDLQGKVKNTCKNALFVHCFAHKLNLVLSQSVSELEECKLFFATLSEIASFFTKSSKRTIALDEQVEKLFPKVAPTRWRYNGHLVETVYRYRQPLIIFFQNIISDKNWDAETINSSRGYLDVLTNDFNFNFILAIFSSIFPYTDVLFDILQTKMNDIQYCADKIADFNKKILEKREQFDEFWHKLENLDIDTRRKRIRTEDVVDVKTSYRHLFVKIMDNISEQILNRFSDFNELKFLELANFYNRKTVPEGALKCLSHHYGNFFDMVALHAQLSVLYQMTEINDLKNCAEVLAFLRQNELDDVYFEVVKFCELVLTIPATSVSSQSSFSVLKRIKTFVRNSTGDDRFSNLALISIEKDLTKTLSQNPQFYEDVIEQFLKQGRHMDLSYK